MMSLPRPALYTGLAAVMLVLALLSLMVGKVWVPFSAWTSLGEDPRWAIIFELRTPRTLLAILVGAALATSGAALQGYTRNPLADPAILGVSSMAALGAVLTLYLGAHLASPWLLSAAAMAGAILGVAFLLVVAGETANLTGFILGGMVLNIVCQSGIALAMNLAPNPWAVNEIIDWLMGSVADRSFREVWLSAPFIAIGLALLFSTGRALDALTLGETGARALGVDIGRTRILLAIGVALAAGASVAVTGVVGFVGLVTAHLLRPFVGARPGALMGPSALLGAAIVLAADIAVRLTPSAVEVKLGVAMAALGGPFFLALLIRERRRLA
jgi:iron complex transport system permease protein